MSTQIPDITINSNIIQRVIEISGLYNQVDFICRNTLVAGVIAERLVALVKQLTHTAIMLEEEVTGKPAATIPLGKYPTHDLETVIDFGKWKGHTVRAVIQTDPVYIMWAHDHVKRFKLSQEVVDALITIL